MTERAIDAVLQRARAYLRHTSRPTRVVVGAWPEEGELDTMATLENPPRPRRDGRRARYDAEDLVLTRRDPRDADVVVILDMSLSCNRGARAPGR